MKLYQYLPKAQCVVKKTDIRKPKFEVFDFHMHMGKLLLGSNYQKRYSVREFVQNLNDLGIYKIVNLDGFYGQDFKAMMDFVKDYSKEIVTFIWIDIDSIDEPDFEERTRRHIEESVKAGAKGIKMWKDITLYKNIRTDDPRLDIVYSLAAKYHLPILIHIADPVAFFEPFDRHNERLEELMDNPEWHFGNREQYPSFEELIHMQEAMIKNNPETTFVVAHVGSYAENLGYVAQLLDQYPNLMIDIAARIAELGRVPYSARKFMIKYADRIVFGSDATPLSLEQLTTYYRFLETEDEYFAYGPEDEVPGQGRWSIYGLHLPDDVLKKIYHENAEKLISRVKSYEQV